MRKILLLSLPLLLYFIISISCGPRNPSHAQKILGKWQMEQIWQSGLDVSKEHNPQNNRWIKFHTNHRFDSDGDPYGKNSGTWNINEENILFLDSDEGAEDDSYWIIEFGEKKMTWKGTSNEFAKNFEIRFSKT